MSFFDVLPHKFHKSQFFFLNCKNHLKKQAQVPQIKIETGYASDLPSMAGSSRTDFCMRLTIVEPG